ncbi:MAG TPA: TonB-dependent receptor plug domain-containing protein [Candidatus Aquilonibacter sp.]|nr:TonB-dependent receptor plug domain-containing protein [Candidatus Aquilonibacter sp.]
MKTKTYYLAFFLLLAGRLLAQSNTGELRLKVSGPGGVPVKATIDLSNDAVQFQRKLFTDDSGDLVERNLSFGRYRIQVQGESFSPYEGIIEIQSELPTDYLVKLNIAAVSTAINVTAEATLLDPERAGSANHIDQQGISDRLTSLPGRSLQDLVNSQPGWLYEGNGVLHPRGSEYQTQFVVDGIPLTDNRSPSFGPEIEADDVDSVTIYTAGIPAEYGRKMGGVVELNTLRDIQPGLHGDIVVSGGSFDTAGAFARLQDTWGKNTVGASASGSMTAHYLNPVVPENYTNRATTGDFSLSFERDLTPKDRLTLIVRHELARYQIPNELVQENGAYLPNAANTAGCPSVLPADEPSDCVFVPGGQLQIGDNFETMGSISYQHIFSSNALGSLRGMSRDNSTDFYSNHASWPLNATQHNDFKEVYFNGAVAVRHGRQEWKTGVEADALFLHENTGYVIPDCADLSDPQCPINLGILDSGAITFAFQGHRPDLEQAAYVEDAIRLSNWAVEAGLRWDHYQLLVNQNAVSPRLAVSRYFPAIGLKIHASYDRIFQTPSFENILLASSPSAEAIDTSVRAVQLPVQPSHGNYYELGVTKGFLGKLRLDANMFRRQVNNYADDSQILSTGISFPIAFDHAILYGAEGKLQVLQWKGFSGFASYSYIVGNAWFPVTGGLFLGDNAINPTTGHFPDSQDQRNTVRARVRYQVRQRLWLALGCDYNSGLPFQPDLTAQQYATEYGQVVVNHLNFNRDRILPYFTQNASVGVDLYQHEKRSVRLQGDVENLGNTLELIDFGGLFSGNAIGPSRSYALRLQTTF